MVSTVVVIGPVTVAFAGFGIRGILRAFQVFFIPDASFLGFVLVVRNISGIVMAVGCTCFRVPTGTVPTHSTQHVGQPDHHNAQYQQGG